MTVDATRMMFKLAAVITLVRCRDWVVEAVWKGLHHGWRLPPRFLHRPGPLLVVFCVESELLFGRFG